MNMSSLVNNEKKGLIEQWFNENRIVVGFAIGFIAVYLIFALAMQSKWYTVMQIKFAYRNNNVDILNRYIDIPSIVGGCYDDVTGDLFSGVNMKAQEKQTFNQFYKLIKPAVCQGTVNIVNEYMTENKWLPPRGSSVLKGREMGIDYEELLERSLVKDTLIKKIGRAETNKTGQTILPILVVDRYTNTEFTLQFLLEKDKSYVWRIVKIINYHDYLVHVRDLCAGDISAYINGTQMRITQYNTYFRRLQGQFSLLAENINETTPAIERTKVKNFILYKIIPAYRDRENYLQMVNVPSGALHLHILRMQSNAKTIEAWQDFAAGMGTNDPMELTKAEENYQAALVLEQKVCDIIKKMPALFIPEIE
ncbi:hypothetical protein [Pectinatus sottacetonis]|uniref:hypothetical protein n=1 Tax=Pectinatus sottacetonis TaxID=1002795 RepID=UPI0018C56A71|nr:hypothetical protein [Pectinatus sottacetonis]